MNPYSYKLKMLFIVKKGLILSKKRMIIIDGNQLHEILKDLELSEPCSEFGFFSKPFRVLIGERECVVKVYEALRSEKLTSFIFDNHDLYVYKLKSIGLNVPETEIHRVSVGNKHQLVIIQEAFMQKDLVRDLISSASVIEIEKLVSKIFDDIFIFWNHSLRDENIGFHPTLRNYAYNKGSLYYFDTFPPMLMKQKMLNRIIIAMSPYGKSIKKIIPNMFINRVTDEYYQLDKMFSGVVGSCCRLRPELAKKILEFSLQYVNNLQSISEEEKNRIKAKINEPPRLSNIWLSVRKWSGNIGMPNVSRKKN